MDGTGDLFKGFVAALPGAFTAEVVAYPRGECLSYEELEPVVRAALPQSEPFVLVAESFSTPLAIRIAASGPANLKALVLCAGFATSPERGWRRAVCLGLAKGLFRVRLTAYAARWVLVGKDAPDELVDAVREAVSSVKPQVLAARVKAVMGADVRAELGRVAVPILYLQAKDDRLVRAWCLEEIRKVQAGVVVVEVDGPHLLFQREPARTAEIVAGFLTRMARGINEL